MSTEVQKFEKGLGYSKKLRLLSRPKVVCYHVLSFQCVLWILFQVRWSFGLKKNVTGVPAVASLGCITAADGGKIIARKGPTVHWPHKGTTPRDTEDATINAVASCFRTT